MAYCADAFSQGWQHMVNVLFSPFRVGFWLLMVGLMYVCENLMHLDPTKFISQDVLEAASKDPSALEPILMQVLLIGVVYFFMMLIILLLSSGARMVYLVGVRNGSVSVFKTIEDLLPRIITYYLWNVIVPIIGLVFIFIATIIFTVIILLPFGITDPLSAGIAVMAIMILMGICVFFVAFTYLIFMRSFVVPQMVFLDKGIFQAWGSTLSLLFSNFFECIGFFLIRFALFISLIIVMLLPIICFTYLFDYIDNDLLRNHNILRGIISNINILLVSMIIEPFMLPYNVFVDSYSLAFLKQLTGDNRLLPGSTASINSSVIPSTDQPTSPPSMQPAQPPQQMPPMQYGPITNEPVLFKDIPVDMTNDVHSTTPENIPENQNEIASEEPKNDPPALPPQQYS